MQNRVLLARKGSKHHEMFTKLMASKVTVLADGFSLRERAIQQPINGVQVADMDRLVQLGSRCDDP